MDNRRGTENSMIQHYTNQSNNNSFEGDMDAYGQVLSDIGDPMPDAYQQMTGQKYYH